MSIPLFGEPLQTKLPQRTLPLIARFGFSVMLIYTLFIFTTAHFTPLIFMLFHRKLLILIPFRPTLHRLMLHHRKLFILTQLIFTLHRLTLFIFMLLISTLFILKTSRLTLHRLTLFHRKLLISTLFIFTLHHRKLFTLTPFRFEQNLRQLLRPFSSYPAPQHRNQFSIAFPNPRKTNLFHSQIIQFLRPVPLN